MQQIIGVAGSMVFFLGLVIYMFVSNNGRSRNNYVEEYGRNAGSDNPGEHMRNVAYHHKASYKHRCKKGLFTKHRKCISNLKKYHRVLRDVPDKFISLVPAAQWLVDNYYVINRESRMVRESYNIRFCRKTPILKGGALDGYPRIYAISREILRVTEYHCNEEDIVSCLNEYQTVKPLTIAELWAFQNALKLSLIECIHSISNDVMDSIRIKQNVDRIIEEIISKGFADTKEFISKLRQKLGKECITNPNYISHILYQLRELDIDDRTFRQWIVDMQGSNDLELSEIIRRESQYQAKLQVRMSSAFTSLIEIAGIDWEGVFEQVSLIEKTLARDPAGIYTRMDFSTRDMYHHAVEIMARETDMEEVEVTKKALALSKGGAGQGGRGICSHVGYYLIGKGTDCLRKSLTHRPRLFGRIRRWLRKNRGVPYFSGVFIISASITTAGFIFSIQESGRSSLPISIVTAFILLVLALTAAVEMVNYLATRFVKATKLPSINFDKAIPDDYRTLVVMPALLTSRKRVDKHADDLETYYLANKDDNLYFAVLGDYNDAESQELPEDAEVLRHAIDRINALNEKYADKNGNRRFLLLNRHRQWNEKQKCWMGWERKRGKLEELNRLIAGDEDTSFSTIIGDRSIINSFRYVLTIDSDTELTKSSAVRLVGIMAHPLNAPVLNRKGTRVVDGYSLLQPRIGVRMHSAMASFFSMVFSGQAGVDPYIYAVSDVYQDNFAEGIFAGKGIYDAKTFYKVLDRRFPENAVLSHDLLEGSLVRCALASDVEFMDGFPSNTISFFRREHRWIRGDWQLLPWIFGRDSLNALSRWKVFDNLRRSLVPAAQFIFIILSLTVLGWDFVYWGPIVMFSMLFSLVVNIGRTTLLRFRRNETGAFVSNLFCNSLMTITQGILLFILIPYRAYISIDAVVRTIYRLSISKRNLLEWTTAEALEKKSDNTLMSHIKVMWPGPVAGVALFLVVCSPSLGYLNPVAVAIAVSWFISPFIAYLTGKQPKKKKKDVSSEQINDLYMLSRKTWRYFEDFFNDRENWLTPDNYQLYPRNVTAQRVSPTNIGFQLLSTLSARDLGFIGVTATIKRIEKVFETIMRMDRWNGHLYNWYNSRTLEILNPRYVSTVDSGNFVSCLIVLKAGLEELAGSLLFSETTVRGLAAAASLAGIDIPHGVPSTCREWNKYLNTLVEEPGEPVRDERVDADWLELLGNQAMSFVNDLTYLELENDAGKPTSIMEMAKHGIKKAEELLIRIEAITCQIEKLIEDMDFGLLYDEKRNLFRVGFNISANSPDNSYYDLLESESRLTGFVAIAKGDVPLKHWFKLGRPLTLVHGTVTLISWSGTMFEYLLPNIFLRQVPNTILEQSNTNAIRRQIEYAGTRKVPWGISESGYYRFDINLNYQYRAFGVPDLGFRADLRKSLVISPYSSILALPDVPRKAYRNLQQLRNLGAEGKYGLYEALDFMSPSVQKADKKFKLIQSYMIHHQGMILASLNNYLNGMIMMRRFHADPMIKGVDMILEECKPHGLVIRKEQEKPVVLRPAQYSGKGYESRVVHTTKPKYPVAHIISNNRYTVMITSNGEGFSSLNNRSINRWKPFLSSEPYGMFFYIRDTVSRKYWSATFQPTVVEPDEYLVTFLPDRIEYKRVDGHIETKTEITVSPQEDVEVRRITITNRSAHASKMEITSYFEPVLDTFDADCAHPAFSKIFVSTEYLEQNEMLLATRRPGRENSETLHVFSTMMVRGRMTGTIEYETDRNSFIGRGNTLRNPDALKSDLPLSNSVGSMLDPIMSIRANLSLLPGRSVVVTYITGAASSREKALELGNRYRREYSIDDIFKMALFDSEVEMNYLGLAAKQVNAIQDLVGSVYYPSRLMRGPVDVIEKNTLGQSGLWKFGLSGDLPVMLFRISSEQQLASLKDTVSAYEYLRKNGVKLDFVILNEEKDDYFQPLGQRISDIISGRKMHYPNTKDARVLLLKSRYMTEEEMNLLLTVSRIVLSDKNRLLSRRIRRQLLEELDEPLKKFSSNKAKIYDEIPLEQESLQFFNGLGGFTFDGTEYVITLNNGQQTPAPWTNVISNEKFGFLATSTGGGYTWAVNSRENRISRWANDPVIDPVSEAVYIRDDNTGEFFSPTPSPARDGQTYRIRHGMGYTAYEHNSRGFKQKMLLYVSERDPVKIFSIELENKSGEDRHLSLYLYVELVLGVSREHTAPYIITGMDKGANMLTARNVYNNEFRNRITFISSSEKISSYTGDNSEFIGKNGSMDRPRGLFENELSNRVGASLDPCAAIKTSILLKKNEKRSMIFILGQCPDEETAYLLAEMYTRPRVAKVVFRRCRKSWKEITGQIRVNTPDPAMNIILNGWLLYQVMSCRMLARSAFYQSGGAYGFRDQLQDSLALLHTVPELTREQIIRCCGRQFREGDVQHWWHEDSGKGVRTRISDDMLWLPYVTAAYIRATGDTSILEEKVSFLEGAPLKKGEAERYFIPSVSGEKAGVYEHCIRAMEKGMTSGAHGLPLIGGGDWNDGMNRVGIAEKGESVWLAWFFTKVVKDFLPVCRLKDDRMSEEKYKKRVDEIVSSLETHAWDGEWYLRAFFDSGEPIGSRHNNECRIDSIPQSWSVISGAADKERASKAMNSLYKYLVNEEDRIVLLLTPPFDRCDPDPGYIRGYLPGIRENGGQYTHAAAWAVIAFSLMGAGDQAHRLFSIINPVTHTDSYPGIMKYKQEPYVICADVYSRYPHAGRGGWSWYTGSAAWMYIAGIEYILGLKKEGKKLYIKPAIPKDWRHYSVSYRYGRTTYMIEIENRADASNGESSIMLDGSRTGYNHIDLEDDGSVHNVLVTIHEV